LARRYDAYKQQASRNLTVLLNLPPISCARKGQFQARIEVTPGTGIFRGTIVRVLKAVDVVAEDLAFSPDGRAIAVGSKQGVFLWNLEAVPPFPVRMDSEESYGKGGLFFSSDGRSLSWLTKEGARRTYDRDTRKTLAENTSFKVQTVDGSQGISLHTLPDYLMIGWRRVDGSWVQTWTVSIAALSVESLTFSSDGQLFAMLTRPALGKGWEQNPRIVEVRDVATATLRGTGEYPYRYDEPLLFSPDCRQLVGFNTMNLMVWPIPESGDLGALKRIRNTSRKQFTAMVYHPTGRYLYVTSNGEDTRNSKDATVHVFDTATWTRVEQFTWKLGNLKAVAVSADGILAAAGSDRGDIVIWDVDI
jgi:WD40 repeat protein